MEKSIKNLDEFIEEEKTYFSALNNGINWEDERWDVGNWLFHRGKDQALIFTGPQAGLMKMPKGYAKIKCQTLPYSYSEFVKALSVYLYRTKGIGYGAISKYVNECRRLYIIMHKRNEESPTLLTRWHFEETLEFLKETGYKNIYDAAATLQVIAFVLDKKKITPNLIDFINPLIPLRSNYAYKAIAEITEDDKRIDDEKLPSYQAMQAYATCTNNPINDDEEVLLRTIDLLIAMGQRGNEVTLIPYDCWVEKVTKDKFGHAITDGNYNGPRKKVR